MKIIEINRKEIIFSILILFLIFIFAIQPEIYMTSTLNGILVWATAVLPALFPFLFLTKLLTQLKCVEKISSLFQKITTKLYNVPGIASYVFLMSIISGYPIGAKLTSELYQNKIITPAQATRMCSFCSTSGPLFIIGTVGCGMFINKSMGIIILLSHIIGALLNGLLYRSYNKDKYNTKINYLPQSQNLDNILSNTMYDSVISILMVGGYIALSFMLIDMLFNLHILDILANLFSYLFSFLNLPKDCCNGIASGIIEVTRGCLDLSYSTANTPLLCILATGIISWGGFSVHLQSLTFLQKCKIKMSVYFIQKITHSILSMLIAIPLSMLLL